MNYTETLDYLFTRLPMFSRIGAAAYKKDITNTIRLCEELGNPQNKFKSIHIAGTNGKGSTSHMLAGILQTAGYKTGLYTSPHLKDFRERIRVGGIMCDEDFVVKFTERIQPIIEEIEPSFFEITVVMAFEYFVQQGVEIAVIEVGLGGRLDSTNIITPELSIITNIGWDHMNMLGDTLEKIAFEKAGIIKPGIPVIIGEVTAITRGVFESVSAQVNNHRPQTTDHRPQTNGQQTNANDQPSTTNQIVFVQEQMWVSEWKHEKDLLIVTVADHHSDERHTYHLDLAGIFQTKNILTVLEAVRMLNLQGWKIERDAVKNALPHIKKLTGLHGRWDVIHHHPRIVLDVGHNEDGMRQIAEQIEISEYHRLHIVIGMVKDKEVEKVLSLLPSYATYYFTKAQIPRALNEVELQQAAAKLDLQGGCFDNVNDALRSAIDHSHADDMIIVCGSVFVVGEVETSHILND